MRRSPNARFILTTRAYIFEEARLVSEYLADQRLDISKYVLDVGIYTRRIKARILYNHLLVAGTPQSHINALIGSGLIGNIIDHKNYNPRIIDWMTDSTPVRDILPESYPAAFIDALTNPKQLWDIAFRTHISKLCQHLLLALFFSSEYGVGLKELKLSYESLHPRLSAKYGEEHGPKDFEAVQLLGCEVHWHAAGHLHRRNAQLSGRQRAIKSRISSRLFPHCTPRFPGHMRREMVK